jgi:hypothetical protein
MQLKQELHNLQKNKMNISDYSTKVKNLADAFTSIGAHVSVVRYRLNVFLSFKRCLNVLLRYQRLAHIKKRWSALLQCQLHSVATLGRIIEAKECKIVGAVDDGDQENAVDVWMEEERVEQKEDDQEQDSEEEKEEPVEESIDHVLFEWSNILGLGMGEADANDNEGLEVVEEGQVRPSWPMGNVPNWPQEPTPAKLTGLRGTKMPLGVLFKGVDLPDSY